MRQKIEDLLMQVGIYPNINGFRFTTDAVEILLKEPEIKITALYEIIARRQKTTCASVERAIRHAARKSNVTRKDGKNMVNSEFLYYIALIMERENKNE